MVHVLFVIIKICTYVGLHLRTLTRQGKLQHSNCTVIKKILIDIAKATGTKCYVSLTNQLKFKLPITRKHDNDDDGYDSLCKK